MVALRVLGLVLPTVIVGALVVVLALGCASSRLDEGSQACAGCGYAIGGDGYCQIHGTADSTACPLR